MRLASLVVLTAAASALAACSDRAPRQAERTTASAAAIQGGNPAPDDTRYAIALIGGGLCSGTLIAPNLVLTARHCVVDQPSESADGCENGTISDPSSLRVTTAPDLGIQGGGGPPPGTKVYGASKILPGPKTNNCDPDIALVQLSKSIPASDATPARPAVDKAYTSRAHFSDTVTAIGYGVDDQGQPGVRRYRTGISVLCVPGDSQFSCPDVDGQIQKFEFVAGQGACHGDSGGGLYDQASFDAKKPVVVGVVSRGGEGANGICAEGVYERVDQFKAFIVAAAVDAAKSGGYPIPDWASEDGPKPEPDAGTPEPEIDAGAEPAAQPAPQAAPSAPGSSSSGCSAAPAPARSNLFALLLALPLVASTRRTRRKG